MTTIALDTAEARASFIEDNHNPLLDLMVSLYGRWQDEKEYEDFNEYKTAMAAKAKECFPEATEIVVSKFKVAMRHPALPYKVVFYVSGSQIGWKSAP